MTGSFPTSVTAYTNPGPTDSTATDIGGRTHDEFHSDNNDDLEAVMTKLGTGASTPSANTVLRGTGAGTTAYGQIAAGDIGAGQVIQGKLAGDAVITASIADSQVTTAKLAADAVTQMQTVYGSTGNPSTTATTSGTAPVIAEMSITMTITSDIVVMFNSNFYHATVADVVASVELWVDSTMWERRSFHLDATAEVTNHSATYGIRIEELPGGAGSRTLTFRFHGSVSGLAAYSAERSFSVIEFKR